MEMNTTMLNSVTQTFEYNLCRSVFHPWLSIFPGDHLWCIYSYALWSLWNCISYKESIEGEDGVTSTPGPDYISAGITKFLTPPYSVV